MLWNPSPVAFYLPFLHYPVRWYGLFFACGFLLSYICLVHLLNRLLVKEGVTAPKEKAKVAIDHLLWYVLIGTLVGARLGEVFFYDWEFFSKHPEEIIKVWHGGLASHGGAIGVFTALIVYYMRWKKTLPFTSFWQFLDLFVVPVPLAGAMIRLGNFFNQEIVGTPSTLPWAVTFLRPAEAVSVVSRHPVQLYEALTYLLLFILLYWLWNRDSMKKHVGQVAGYFFILLFGARFFLEFFKTAQSTLKSSIYFDMGQLLSLPFILFGVILVLKSKHKSK